MLYDSMAEMFDMFFLRFQLKNSEFEDNIK